MSRVPLYSAAGTTNTHSCIGRENADLGAHTSLVDSLPKGEPPPGLQSFAHSGLLFGLSGDRIWINAKITCV